VKYNQFFLFIPFLRNSSTGQTDHQIFMLDGSCEADSCRGVFLALVDIAAYLWGQITPMPQFGGVNMRFPSKRAKY